MRISLRMGKKRDPPLPLYTWIRKSMGPIRNPLEGLRSKNWPGWAGDAMPFKYPWTLPRNRES